MNERILYLHMLKQKFKSNPLLGEIMLGALIILMAFLITIIVIL